MSIKTPLTRILTGTIVLVLLMALILMAGLGSALAAAPGDIVINEIMQNPSAVSDSSGEWFEVFNPTGSSVDINGWTVKDNDFDSHVINNGAPLLVPAGGFLLLGINSDSASNGGIAVDYQYSGLFLGNGSDELVLVDDLSNEIDRVEWDNGVTFPDPNGASMALLDPSLDNNLGGNWCTGSTPFGDGDLGTPGAANDCGPPPPPTGVCGDPATLISAIQGSGTVSPEVGNVHSIEGVVVGDFQNTSTELRGFFLQEEDSDADADATTSEGIFVFDNGFGVDVNPGDIVRVDGTVDEFFDLTELGSVTSVQLCPAGGTASAATVTLPLPSVGDWEFVEGMLVTIPQTLVVSDNFNQGRFGEVGLSVGARLETPTNVVAPGAAANALQDLNDRSLIQLDDGSNVQNPLPLPPYIGLNNTLRGGDTIPSLTGAVGFAFGSYEIHPTGPVNFTRVNTRDPLPPSVGGSLKVAAFNVLNYFTTIDDSEPICGPGEDQDCRGADTDAEFANQRAKIIAAITTMDADIVGLMELENKHAPDPALDDTPLVDLVSGLNEVAGEGTYAFIPTGSIGTDAIKVGLIYKPGSVTPAGPFAILDNSVDSRFNDDKNRPVLLQTFQENGTNDVVSVAVNHLKSKGSPCDDVGDPDVGDGQGNCNVTRTLAAEAMVDWLATDPTGSGSAEYMIIGDLNAYLMEDPIGAIKAGGYTNLVDAFQGPGEYSFVFFGQAGALDHALSSSALTPRITGAAFWHINADEPRALDYNNFNQPALYNPDPYRSSDHDPVIVGVCETTPPEVEVALSPDMLWPPNHKYVDVTAAVAVSDADPNPTVTLLSVTSDEPDDGLGDGDTSNDIVILDGLTFQLRAERSGTGDGRTYTVTYEVVDACGNASVASATVQVPLSQGG